MHTYMSLDWVRKPENPEETPAALGEHANSPRKIPVMQALGIKPPAMEV